MRNYNYYIIPYTLLSVSIIGLLPNLIEINFSFIEVVYLDLFLSLLFSVLLPIFHESKTRKHYYRSLYLLISYFTLILCTMELTGWYVMSRDILLFIISLILVSGITYVLKGRKPSE